MTQNMSKPTQLYDAYIFDLDGTVYLGDSFLPTEQASMIGDLLRCMRLTREV